MGGTGKPPAPWSPAQEGETMEWSASSSSPSDMIEAEDGPVDEDEFVAEDWDARASDSTSMTSSVYAHTYEHGRRYHRFRAGRYPIPNDDVEQNRQDMMHALMLELTVCGRLLPAEARNYPPR